MDSDFLRPEARIRGLSTKEEGFSEMEAFLERRGSMLVISLPKTRLGGTFLRRNYIRL